MTDSTRTKHGDTRTVAMVTEILAGRSKKRRLAQLLPFLGPAFIANVAYVASPLSV